MWLTILTCQNIKRRTRLSWMPMSYSCFPSCTRAAYYISEIPLESGTPVSYIQFVVDRAFLKMNYGTGRASPRGTSHWRDIMIEVLVIALPLVSYNQHRSLGMYMYPFSTKVRIMRDHEPASSMCLELMYELRIQRNRQFALET